MKLITTIILSNLFFCVTFCNVNNNKDLKTNQVEKIAAADTILPKPEAISFSAVGDIMLGSNFPSAANLPPESRGNLLEEADSLLKSTDFTFGNCEGTFLNSGGTPKGTGQNIYCFRQPEAYAEKLKNTGFNLISIANNHINDFGPVGINSTTKTLDLYKLNYAGTPSHPYTILKKGNISVGLIAFAPHSGCLDMNDISRAQALVSDLKKKADIVMVSFHGGAEGAGAQHVSRKREIFYGQDRGNVYEFAHKMIDAGADVLIGHGPHVVRALEIYKSRLIAYSLGNFCTYGMFNLSGVSAAAPLLQFKLNSKGEFLNGQIHSFKQLNEGGPIKDNFSFAANLIRQLTENDFPEETILISEQGLIEPLSKK